MTSRVNKYVVKCRSVHGRRFCCHSLVVRQKLDLRSLSLVCVLFMSLCLPGINQSLDIFYVLDCDITTVLAWVSDTGTHVQYVYI